METRSSPEEVQKVVWDHYISPATLLEQVWNTAPFLREREPGTFLSILRDSECDWEPFRADPQDAVYRYFALCLAAHHATVGTYVPTDVDTKIRGLLWRETKDLPTLRRMADLAFEARDWPLEGVSRRYNVHLSLGPISGHNGEWLSVIAGAHGRFLALGDADYAERTAAAIDTELRREARCFIDTCLEPGAELDTMRIAMSITHNLGDLNQGISFWSGGLRNSDSAKRFERLAQENRTGYEGIFQRPAELYREMLSAEGHRHYPLRPIRALRRHADLLIPLGPFLDDYGAMLCTTPHLSLEDRAEVLDGLVRGCKKVANQSGYFRAIAGFREAGQRTFDDTAARMPSASQKLLRDAEIRQKTAIPRRSFESAYSKRVEQMRRQYGEAMRSAAAALAR